MKHSTNNRFYAQKVRFPLPKLNLTIQLLILKFRWKLLNFGKYERINVSRNILRVTFIVLVTLWLQGKSTGTSTFCHLFSFVHVLVPYGEILTTLFMRFKSRDPVICIFITWSRDYDSNAIDRFYTKNKKNMNYFWQSGYPETVMDHELVQHVHILWNFNLWK